MNGNRVVVIGIDGGTFDFIKPLIEKGKLPNIKKIMDSGCYGELESTVLPYTPQAWTSFMTGTNPGKHGIFGFTRHKKNEYQVEFVNARVRNKPAIWEILGKAGQKAGVINVPMTFPPDQVNGFLISGMDAPAVNKSICYPTELYRDLKRFCPGYIVEPGIENYCRQGKYEKAIERLIKSMDLRFDLAARLFKDRNPEFFMVVFSSVDRVQHQFWNFYDRTHPLFNEAESNKFGDAIDRIYEKQDELLGKFLELAGEESHIVIISDHGAGTNDFNRAFSLQKWLESEGLLEFLSESKQEQKKLIDKMFSLAHKTLSRKVKESLSRVLPGLKGKVLAGRTFAGINWKKTRVFADFPLTYLWVNLKGKYPQGIVEPGQEYEELKNSIVKRLNELKDPRYNENIVEKVYKKEEIYSGEMLQKAPDIIVVLKKGYMPGRFIDGHGSAPWVGKLMLRESGEAPAGGHRMNGIFLIKGKEVKEGV